MAKNTYLNNVADSSAEDLIRTIQQLGCAEVHAKSLYDQTRAGLENGLIEEAEIERQIAKIQFHEESIVTYAELRRKATMALYKMYESEVSDKKIWCQIKHLSIASYTAFEAWQSSEDNHELLELAYEANKAFTRALTAFIGAEVTDCAACLGEYFKNEGRYAEYQE